MGNAISKESLINDMPKRLKYLHNVLWPVAHVERVLWLSFILITISYMVDCYYQEYSYISICGSLVSVLGLILTIKNSFLKNLESTISLARASSNGAECTPLPEDEIANKAYREKLYKSALEEATGVSLVILGTLINAFASKIPLVSLCN
jgi:hypothetical protein